MQDTILVTGANRGIGLEFVTQYAADGCKVIACCRNPKDANNLIKLQQKYSDIVIEQLDVTSKEDLANLSNKITTPIDILINCAGIYGEREQSLTSITRETMHEVFNVNTIAPLFVTLAFKKNVAASRLKIVAGVSSRMGSIDENTSGQMYAYRTSKAGLNMVLKSLSIDLAGDQISVIALHPGWVKTDMGGSNAILDVVSSVSGLRKIIVEKSLVNTLPFYAYDGREFSW